MPGTKIKNKHVCNRKCEGTFGVQCIKVEFMIFTLYHSRIPEGDIRYEPLHL